jgi:hypothetical protein
MEGFMGKLIIGAGFSVLFIIIMAFISLIGAIPTYFLWNWLMPDIFGITALSFWQAWGIFWLASILVKGSSSVSSK